MSKTSTRVALSYAPSEYADAPHLLLEAVALGQPWNGFAVPHVTAAEFRRWITAMHHNDANGIWGDGDGVTEGDGALIYRDEEHRGAGDAGEMFTVAGMHEGQPVYAIAGWEFYV